MVFTNGIATFELGNGESRTAKDIPIGTRFRVEEVRHDEGGFATVAQVVVMDAGQADSCQVNPDKSITGQIIKVENAPVAIVAAYTNNTDLTNLTVIKKWRLNMGVMMEDTDDSVEEVKLHLWRRGNNDVEIDADPNKEGIQAFSLKPTLKEGSETKREWKLVIDNLEKYYYDGSGDRQEYKYFVIEDTGNLNSWYPQYSIDGVNFVQSGDAYEVTGGNTITVLNNKASVELPKTGGPGTALYGLIGGLMVITAGAVLTLRKNNNKA